MGVCLNGTLHVRVAVVLVRYLETPVVNVLVAAFLGFSARFFKVFELVTLSGCFWGFGNF